MRTPVRLALWGAGTIFRRYFPVLAGMRERGEVELVALVDNNPQGGSLCGLPITRPADLRACDADYVVVLNKHDADEIALQAERDCGFSEEVVLRYLLLDIPGFDFPRYHALRMSKPSIISNSSWDESACRILQLRHSAPFSGLRFREGDYLRLLEHFDAYMAVEELGFAGWRTDAWGRRYLAAFIGDIAVRCHDVGSVEEAQRRWDAGKMLLNRDRVAVQLHTLNPLCERRFDALEGFARKFCFVPYATGVPSSLQVPPVSDGSVYELSVEAMFDGSRAMLPRDVIGLLLGDVGGKAACAGTAVERGQET